METVPRIGIVKYFILYTLFNKGKLRLNELTNEVCKLTKCSPSSIKKYVYELCNKGFIKKNNNYLELTFKGIKLLYKNLGRNKKVKISSEVSKDKPKLEIPHWSSNLTPFTLNNFINFIRHEFNNGLLRVRKYVTFNGIGYVLKIECFTKGLVDELENLELTQFIQNGLLILYWSRKDKSLIFEYRTLPNHQFEQTVMTLNYVKQDLVNCVNFINNAFTELVIKTITLFKLTKIINDYKLRRIITKSLRQRPSIIEESKAYFIHNLNKSNLRKNIFKNFEELRNCLNQYLELGIKFKLSNVKRPRFFRSFVITLFKSIDKFGIQLMIDLRKNDHVKLGKILSKILKILNKVTSLFNKNFIIELHQKLTNSLALTTI